MAWLLDVLLLEDSIPQQRFTISENPEETRELEILIHTSEEYEKLLHPPGPPQGRTTHPYPSQADSGLTGTTPPYPPQGGNQSGDLTKSPLEGGRGVSTLLALLSYALLSLGWTYPLIANFSTKMFGWGGDRYIYLWNMWWLKKALLDIHTNPLYTDYIYYPKGISLAFHDFSLLLTTVSLPLQVLFSLEEIYNLFFIVGISYPRIVCGCFYKITLNPEP